MSEDEIRFLIDKVNKYADDEVIENNKVCYNMDFGSVNVEVNVSLN